MGRRAPQRDSLPVVRGRVIPVRRSVAVTAVLVAYGIECTGAALARIFPRATGIPEWVEARRCNAVRRLAGPTDFGGTFPVH